MSKAARSAVPAAAGLALAAAFVCGQARAGAWPMADGATQAILKYEHQVADEAYDPNAEIVPIPKRTEEALSLFVEHGLTERLTLQTKFSYVRGEDIFSSHRGRGPTELGLRYAVMKGPRTAVSLYVGAVLAGEGRNAGYATPGQGDSDLEVRLLAGRSGVWLRRPVFTELQIARLERSGLADETRLDTTLGVAPADGWLVMVQTYAGRAEQTPVEPVWLKGEVSVVRNLGDWRLQAGWRQSLAGVQSPVEAGPVIALWRLF